MTQITALENAFEALRSYSEMGNDDASEAAGIIEGMRSVLITRRKRARSRRNWNKLGELLKTVPPEFRSSKR